MFKDLLVVEFAQVLAGPSVGLFFAELGARVIKVENPLTAGDMTRKWKVPGEDPEASVSAYYASANWGKEVLDLNLKTKEGLEKAKELVSKADIVLTNFRSGQDLKLGLDPATLHQLNPTLLIGKITGYGPNNPKAAFDVVLQAETGFLSMTGTPNAPAKIPVAVIDLFAAHQLKEGLLLALLQKEKNGKGALVSVSLYDAAVASLANQASNWLMAGHLPQRMGCAHPNIAPYGDLFISEDQKELILAVGTEAQFQGLARILAPELGSDPRFSTNASRVKNRNDLAILLQTAIGEWPRERLLNTLEEANIPASRVQNLEEVFSQPEAQKLVLEEEREGTLTKRVRTAIFQIDYFSGVE